MSGMEVPAGWYPDPTGSVGAQRYFDGSAWTAQTRRVAVSFPPAPGPAATTSAQPAAPTPVPSAPASTPDPFTPSPAWRPAMHAPSGSVALATPPYRAPLPATSVARPASSAPAAGALPSLLDALQYAPAPDTAQGLLRGAGTDRLMHQVRVSAAGSSPGWYPDPARSGALRYYNGKQWTARTRTPVDDRKRKLPKAAMALHAKVIAAADVQARLGGAQPRKVRTITVARSGPVPSLHLATRSRSGAVLGMAFLLTALVGLTASVMIAWQLWGSNLYEQSTQGDLRQELAQQAKASGGAYDPFTVTGDETPVAVPAPSATPTATSTPTRPGTPAPKPKPAGQPALNSHPADIAPWPPGGWTPPPGRVVPTMPKGDGKAVGRLIIPRMGLDRVFVLGTGESDLKKGPGLWKWGAFPGTPGTTTISGHRTTYGAPFYNMDKLRYGDQIIIEVPGQPRAVYEVRGRVIASPFDVQVTRAAPGVHLTLTTCHPIHSAAQRMVVQAELIEGAWLDKSVNRSQWQVLR